MQSFPSNHLRQIMLPTSKKDFKEGDDDFIPLERRVGFLDPRLADRDIECK